jgi:hypothetical protein
MPQATFKCTIPIAVELRNTLEKKLYHRVSTDAFVEA